MTELRTSPSAVTALGGQLDNIAADVGAVINGAPAVSDLVNSHGTIGFPADFEGASQARTAAVGATKMVSAKMAETLRQAAKAYERGDQEAAEKLKAQADQMAGGRSSGSSNDAGGAGGGLDGGMQAGGQMMSQFSQMAGQMMQGVTQPVQGIVQGLTQVPQQVMQGVQGIVQAATQGAAGAAGGAGALGGPEAAPAGAGQPQGAGAPAEGEKAPAHAGIMSEERMRELQGLPPLHPDEAPHEPKPGSSPRVHPGTARDL